MQRDPSPDEARRLLCALGDHVREVVAANRHLDFAAVDGRTAADTIYAVDRLADDALLEWFAAHWTDVRIVSEGLDGPVVVGDEPIWTVIVDAIDGTRGLMHDKRSAWCLAAAAPGAERLADLTVAAMTELPTTKHGWADQLSAVRGSGIVAERVDVRSGGREPLTVRPSSATDLEHGFATIAKFFRPGKADLVDLETELFDRLGVEEVFDDEYLSSGGQLYELLTGRDRFVADLRPLVDGRGLACHPYDLCTAFLLAEVGGVVTDPTGAVLDAPLDTTTPVAWAGYANPALAAWIGPVLREVVAGRARR